MLEKVYTAIGTPNIALVKYWGKRDENLNLPTNSSLSITLDESMHTKTSIIFSKKLKEDKLYINRNIQNLEDLKDEKLSFVKQTISYMKSLSKTDANTLIVSENSFPESVGLASSASGAATLTYALSKALELQLKPKEMSVIARRISGSACRGLFGGFVKWNKGERVDGLDSYAEQIADQKHWPEIINIIAIVSETKKKIPSSAGHKITVNSSYLYKQRPTKAEENVNELSTAILKKDFAKLAEITMKDSNDMHATCLDSYPPIFYLSDISKEIIYAIHDLNDSEKRPIAAYTFDAGPNANIITTVKNKEKVKTLLEHIVGDDRIIETGQGEGPRLLPVTDSLIDQRTLKLIE